MSTHDLHECFNMALNFLDIRVKICLSIPTNEHVKELEKFYERYKISHSEDAVKLRRHFNDLLDKVMHVH